MGEHHRDARADEEEGEARGEVDAELGLARVVPLRARPRRMPYARSRPLNEKPSEQRKNHMAILPGVACAELRVRAASTRAVAVPVVIVAVARARGDAARGAFDACLRLRGCSGCAHGALFPLCSRPITSPSLVRELSDGKSYFRPRRAFRDIWRAALAKIVR